VNGRRAGGIAMLLSLFLVGTVDPCEEAAVSARVLRRAVTAFHDANGRYPTEKEGLRVLMVEKSGNHPYIKENIRDPWGHEYVYVYSSEEPKIVSSGPDGQLGTPDDIASNDPRPCGTFGCTAGASGR
jgi:type II secretion system (T2SS) protein G